MMRAGLVSITFRALSPEEIVRACVGAGLTSIEWGGDIHVPHGDRARAAEVGRMTREAGLNVAAYGSYYRLAASPSLSFDDVLDSAVALGAPSIRVWAGDRGSASADHAWRSAVAEEALRCADQAAERGIRLCYEFHGGTLTDSLDSTLALLDATRHPAIATLWQPPVASDPAENVRAIRALAPRLAHVHVFHWGPGGGRDRLPLAAGREAWDLYVDTLRGEGFSGDMLLEFVVGDDPAQLAIEAATLQGLISAGWPR